MATSQELKTAARVLRDEEFDAEEAIQELEAKAEKVEKLERYLFDLGILINPRNSPHFSGMKVYKQLLEDGWTPPESLL